MRLNVFNGGLHTRPAPHLIKTNESRVFTNVDNSKGILTPIKDKVSAVTGASQFSFFYVEEQEWQFSETPTDWLEFQKRLYYSDRTTEPQKIADGVTSRWGIAPPEGFLAPVPVSSSGTVDLSDYTFTAVETVPFPRAGFPSDPLTPGTYTYKILRYEYNASLDISLPVISDPVDVVVSSPNKAVVIDSVFTGGSISAYRQVSDGYRKLVVNNFPLSTSVADNSISGVGEYLIGTGNVPLGFTGEYQYAVTYYNSITGVESGPLFSDSVNVAEEFISLGGIPVSTDPQVDKKRIYRIGGSYTEFVLVDEIDNTTTVYGDAIPDVEVIGTLLTTATSKPAPTGLQFITTAYAMIFGAVDNQLRFTPIAQPESWPDLYFIDFPMPITGISLTSNGILVHTKHKTYIVTGTGPSTLSQQLFSETQGCINGDSCVSVAGNALWVSTDGLCLSQGSDVKVITKPKLGKATFDSVIAVVHDQEYYLQLNDGTVFVYDFDDSILKYSNFGTTSLTAAEDTLYGFSVDTLFELEAGTTSLEFEYLSPEIIGPTYTKTKAYKSIYITSLGEIEASVYVDGNVVLTQEFSGGKKINEIKLPSSSARGLLIQIGFKGTGTVYEVMIDEGDTNV